MGMPKFNFFFNFSEVIVCLTFFIAIWKLLDFAQDNWLLKIYRVCSYIGFFFFRFFLVLLYPCLIILNLLLDPPHVEASNYRARDFSFGWDMSNIYFLLFQQLSIIYLASLLWACNRDNKLNSELYTCHIFLSTLVIIGYIFKLAGILPLPFGTTNWSDIIPVILVCFLWIYTEQKDIGNPIYLGLVFLCIGNITKAVIHYLPLFHWIQFIELLLSATMLLLIPILGLFVLNNLHKLLLNEDKDHD